MLEILAIQASLGGIFDRIDDTTIDKHMDDDGCAIAGDAGLILDIEGLFTHNHSNNMVDEGDLHHPAGVPDKGTAQTGDYPLLIWGDLSNAGGKQYDNHQENKKKDAKQGGKECSHRFSSVIRTGKQAGDSRENYTVSSSQDDIR
jgi:hypothetical protein